MPLSPRARATLAVPLPSISLPTARSRKLSNIVYLCTSNAGASGGVKVICRHAQIIEEARPLGIRSEVLFPEDLNFQPTWFNGRYRVKRDLVLNRFEDLAIVPEMMSWRYAPIFQQIDLCYGIFVQNGYYLLNGLGDVRERLERYRQAYEGAAIILSISDDTTACIVSAFPSVRDRIVKVQWSIDGSLFHPGSEKKNVISFMPRKMAGHAERVLGHLLLGDLGGWNIRAIDGLDEAGVAAALRESRIFMAFSDMEGLPLPPMEAALSGNKVIGYTGQGAREYWHEPLFTEIEAGDLVGFANAVRAEVRRQSAAGTETAGAELAPAIAQITERYSQLREIEVLGEIITRAADVFAARTPLRMPG